MSLFGGGEGAYTRDKNTSVQVCTKNAGEAYVRGGAYLRDTTVVLLRGEKLQLSCKYLVVSI